MRIQHNISAMNSYRQMGGNNNALSKNLEKLSSGYRINRAGDDAAGLAISEKMRAQIKGLETAQKNANDGISLVQTAEGALTEVHSMLNRMAELATQSANGTYEDKVDRENLQAEVDALLSEIDRISKSTNFNGINLLDGSLGGGKVETVDGAASVSATPGAQFAQAALDATKPTVTVTQQGAAAVGAATAAKFEVTLSGLAYTETGTAGSLSVKIGGSDVYTDAACQTPHTGLTTGTSAGAVATSTATDNIGADLNNKYVKIDNQVFKMTYSAADDKLTLTAETTGALANHDAIKTALNTTGVVVTSADSNTTVDTASPAANTFTDTAGQDVGDAQKEKFELDFTGKSLSALTDDTVADKFKYTIGDKTYELEVSADMDDAALASALKDKIGTDEITISGTAYKVTGLDATGKKLQFEAVAGGTATDVTAAAVTAAPSAATAPTRVDGKQASTTIDFDGRTGADLIGGTLDVGGTKVYFVENAADVPADAPAGSKTVTLTKEDKASDIANKLATALGTTLTNTQKIGGVDTPVAFTVAQGTGADDTKVTIAETGTTDANDGTKTNYVGANAVEAKFSGTGLKLQIGDTSDDFNKLSVSVADMSTKGLDIENLKIDNQTDASNAIKKIKAAINTVSSTRGDLGAVQNRLEHTINNLGVTTENITAAESRIRDTDMASEMMAYTKNNILIQASQAMLAQANQVPQGVLQLLQ